MRRRQSHRLRSIESLVSKGPLWDFVDERVKDVSCYKGGLKTILLTVRCVRLIYESEFIEVEQQSTEVRQTIFTSEDHELF